MKRITNITHLVKKIHRIQTRGLILSLEQKGFTDFRPSFIEILIYVCESDGSSIKDIGKACDLKKQTMTSHLNELKKRGYVSARENPKDQREQQIFLTGYGEKFKNALHESLAEMEKTFVSKIGSVELERVEFVLENYSKKIALIKS